MKDVGPSFGQRGAGLSDWYYVICLVIFDDLVALCKQLFNGVRVMGFDSIFFWMRTMNRRLLVGGPPVYLWWSCDVCVLMPSVSLLSRILTRVTLSSTSIECGQQGV